MKNIDSVENVNGYALNDAFRVWMKAREPHVTYRQMVNEFKYIIGFDSFLRMHFDMSPKAAAMIRAMNGPHGDAGLVHTGGNTMEVEPHIVVDYGAVNKAFDNWGEHFPSNSVGNQYNLFWRFLMIDGYIEPSRDKTNRLHYKLPPEGARRVEMLKGQYCYAIMRAWFISQNLPWS